MIAPFAIPADPSDIPVLPLRDLDLRFAPKPWAFAEERSDAIQSHFAELRRDMPALFNGRVLLMHEHTFEGGVLRGAYLETNFASFLAWRDWDFPDASMRNCFALGALRGSDGAFLMGVMGAHTANAGRVYFPGGTPDPSDVFDGKVDLEASVVRELEEETGIGRDAYDLAPGWTAALAGPRIGMLKTLHAREPAAALRDRVRAHIAAEQEPELEDMRIVGGPHDLDDTMPPFIHAFLHHLWSTETAGLTKSGNTK